MRLPRTAATAYAVNWLQPEYLRREKEALKLLLRVRWGSKAAIVSTLPLYLACVRVFGLMALIGVRGD